LIEPIEDFPIYTDNDRLTYLAYFYERLARWLLHKDAPTPNEWLSQRSKDHFDIVEDDTLLARIEVKGVSDNNRLMIFKSQLNAQRKQLLFPYQDGIMMIFCYHNQAKAEHHISIKTGGTTTYHPTLLKTQSGKHWSELSRFLAEKTYRAYAVDIDILYRLLRRRGTWEYGRDKYHPPRKILQLRRTDLEYIAAHAASELRQLGIRNSISAWLPPHAKSIWMRNVQCELDGNPINFQLIPLLPNAKKIRFLKRLNGTVHGGGILHPYHHYPACK